MVFRTSVEAPTTYTVSVICTSWLCFGKVYADILNSHDWLPASLSEPSRKTLEKEFLSRIEKAKGHIGGQLNTTNLQKIESNLKAIFQVLPKTKKGELDHASVRYLMYRYFVEQRGWVVEGLLHGSSGGNVSSPIHRLSNWLPSLVQDLFKNPIVGDGFSIQRLAILLTTVEDAVHEEARERLLKMYKVFRKSPKHVFDTQGADKFVDGYMVSLLLNTNLSTAAASKIEEISEHMGFYYSPWPTIRKWLREVRQRITKNGTEVSFEHMFKMVQEITDTFGHVHGRQCQQLKGILKGLEEKPSTGCVRLPDFYAKGVDGGDHWHFVESPDLLRHMGALEESDVKNPRVLIANYINSATNCIQASSYFLVCCQNECDNRIAHLERQIGAPTATPEQILSALGWDLHSLGKIPAILRRRLYDVSHRHRGYVPIHGRLFAQWLHHAYPHECQYPHLSRTKHPMWVDMVENLHISNVEMKAFAHNATASHKQLGSGGLSNLGSCVPWVEQEEPFHVALPPSLQLAAHTLQDDPHVWGVASAVAMMGALAATSMLAIRSCKSLVVTKRFFDHEGEACPQLVECL